MYDPALVIEGKGARGEDSEAVNQACRAGAALVNAGRLLRERIGDPDVEGADDRTFVWLWAQGTWRFSSTGQKFYLPMQRGIRRSSTI